MQRDAQQRPAWGRGSLAGERLGRYEVVRELASGGMATVYLGRASGAAGFERLVAIKVCHENLRVDREFSTMFLDEARIAAKIRHPNVVGTLDVSDGDPLYLVMEYIEGDGLLGLMKSARAANERIPPSIALRIVSDALLGLGAAHDLRNEHGESYGIIHRDISPPNILVGIDGVSRIADFGIAKAVARATITREGELKGKLSYMAPEQLGTMGASQQSDLFAAAIVLWETLAGKPLFRGVDEADTMRQMMFSSPEPPSSFAPDVTPALDAVVLRGLDHDLRRRFKTAGEFVDALDACGVKIASARGVTSYLMAQANRAAGPDRVAGTSSEPSIPTSPHTLDARDVSQTERRATPNAPATAPHLVLAAPTEPTRDVAVRATADASSADAAEYRDGPTTVDRRTHVAVAMPAPVESEPRRRSPRALVAVFAAFVTLGAIAFVALVVTPRPRPSSPIAAAPRSPPVGSTAVTVAPAVTVPPLEPPTESPVQVEPATPIAMVNPVAEIAAPGSASRASASPRASRSLRVGTRTPRPRRYVPADI